MSEELKPYDVLQIKRPGQDWSDFATLRDQLDFKGATRIVQGTAIPFGTDSSCGWRIRRVFEDRTVLRRNPEA